MQILADQCVKEIRSFCGQNVKGSIVALLAREDVRNCRLLPCVCWDNTWTGYPSVDDSYTIIHSKVKWQQRLLKLTKLPEIVPSFAFCSNVQSWKGRSTSFSSLKRAYIIVIIKFSLVRVFISFRTSVITPFLISNFVFQGETGRWIFEADA